MKLIFLSTFIAAIIFLIIDLFWLSITVKYFYKPNLGNLLLDTPVIWAAIAFYIMYVLGLSIVVIEPAIGNDINSKFLLKSFMFGLVAYGTYNLTNMATLKGWSTNVVFVDMFWGGLLTATSSTLGIIIAKRLLI
tara:strand:- start:1980 stop:2384 length:405 start_codon:yes stop_codon:yes gene_type:complete